MISSKPPDSAGITDTTDMDLTTLMIEYQREGEGQIFARLHEFGNPKLESYFRKRAAHLGSSLEDMCQEVWIRVTRFKHRFDPTLTFDQFLFCIAKNVLCDFHTKQKSRMEVELHDFDTPINTSSVISETYSHLIPKLPVKCVQVMQCLYVKGMSIRECAKYLGMSKTTVDRRHNTGLTELRSMIMGQ